MKKVIANLLIAAMMVSAFPLVGSTIWMDLSEGTESISIQSPVNPPFRTLNFKNSLFFCTPPKGGQR